MSIEQKNFSRNRNPLPQKILNYESEVIPKILVLIPPSLFVQQISTT